MNCQHCGKPLEGLAPSFSANGQQNTTIPLCANCLEKAAQLVRKEQNTYQIIYVLTRVENLSPIIPPQTMTLAFHTQKQAEHTMQELYETDTGETYKDGILQYITKNENGHNIYAQLETVYVQN